MRGWGGVEGSEHLGEWEGMWVDRWANGGRRREGAGATSRTITTHEGEKRHQYLKEEAGPPAVEELKLEDLPRADQGGKRTVIDNAELFRQLQEASRREAERRYQKWAGLRQRKVNGSKCGNGGELVRLADEDKGQKGKGGGVAAAYVQPEPGPVIEEELGSSSSGGRGKGEAREKASGGMEVAGRQGRGDGSDGTAKGGGDKRKKRRGKRQRGTNFSEIITINSSGFPQLRQLLEARGRTEGSVVVLAQEHHRKEAQVLDVQAVARKNGWKGTSVPAVVGEGGGSVAGVAFSQRLTCLVGFRWGRHMTYLLRLRKAER